MKIRVTRGPSSIVRKEAYAQVIVEVIRKWPQYNGGGEAEDNCADNSHEDACNGFRCDVNNFLAVAG